MKKYLSLLLLSLLLCNNSKSNPLNPLIFSTLKTTPINFSHSELNPNLNAYAPKLLVTLTLGITTLLALPNPTYAAETYIINKDIVCYPDLDICGDMNGKDPYK